MKRIGRSSSIGIHPLLIPLLCTLTGCNAETPPPAQPIQQVLFARFAATAPDTEAPDRAPTFTIAHDTRPIWGPVRSVRMVEPSVLVLDAAGRVRLPFEAGAGMLAGQRVAVEPTWRDDAGWHELPTQSAVFEIDAAQQPSLVIQWPEGAGRTLELYAKAHGPLPAGQESIWLPETSVPDDGRLDLAIGVLRLGSDTSAFEYEIDACLPSVDGAPPDDDCRSIAKGDAAGAGDPGWLDLRVPLEGLAGRRVSIRLSVRRAGATSVDGSGENKIDAGFALPVWSQAAIWARKPAAPARRNVMLVSLDTLRADHLPFYGYPVATAPFLDEAFAQRGTLFEHPVAAASSTASSHMSMFTGLDALVHQVSNMYRSLPGENPTLAERLRDAGYATGAVTENGALLLSQGFGRGFASYYENKQGDVTSFEGQAEATLERAEQWLRRHRDEPFFLFVHTYQVHYPYTPPPGYEALIPGLPDSVAAPADIPPERHPLLYDREIRYLDDLLRGFFSRIVDLGIEEDTLVVITSDHGDEFYEHDYLDHGATVFDSVTHVPLIVRGPGIPAGLRIATPVGHIDLTPTLLELVGVAPTPDIAGRSLVPLIDGHGDAEAAFTERMLYSETRVRWALHRQEGGGLLRIKTPTISVRRGDKKVIRDVTDEGPRLRFYDLAADPGEQQPTLEAGDGDFSNLEFMVNVYPFDHKRIAEARAAGEATTAESNSAEDGEGDSLGRVPDYEEQLRALGYVE